MRPWRAVPPSFLIDELAHTNAPGLRHAKRWQDVQELLKAGITVYTTVNVQHLESLNDVVTQITGVRVRETVPDSVIERADDVELIDLPPDDLLQRLKDGKVYVPEQIQHAIQNFFTKGNLIALRELALRRTAERVDQQMEVYRRDHAVIRTWPAAETIMVCVNMKPRGPRLIRAARQMAADLHAKWIAVYVQIPRHLRLPQAERDRLVQTLRLAEQLGAETVTLTGERVAQELLSYARSRNATKTHRRESRFGLFGKNGSSAPWCRSWSIKAGTSISTSSRERRAKDSRSSAAASREPAIGREYLYALVGVADSNGRRLGDVPLFRSGESDHDVPDGGDRHRDSTGARSLGPGLGCERSDVRLLLRAALPLVCRLGHPICVDLRRHADRGVGDQQSCRANP